MYNYLYLRHLFSMIQVQFDYQKQKVIQALRYHFVSQKEIKWLIIIVNVFAIFSAVLLYLKYIRPEPFLLSSVLWVLMAASIWYILPYMVYKKTDSFKQSFKASIHESGITLSTNQGQGEWLWKQFSHSLETPHFFHLYFSNKSFFLIPKDVMLDADLHTCRGYLKKINE